MAWECASDESKIGRKSNIQSWKLWLSSVLLGVTTEASKWESLLATETTQQKAEQRERDRVLSTWPVCGCDAWQCLEPYCNNSIVTFSVLDCTFLVLKFVEPSWVF